MPANRVYAVDVLRGLTILLMIFVNEVSGIRNLPQWLHHMPHGADGMTMVDWVFAGFLFIVGMSIPLALNSRIQKGDSFWQLQKHILVRTLALLVLGVFMVNAEGEHKANAMIISMGVWSLLLYIFVILVWNIYTFKNKVWTYVLRGLGIGGLIFLAVIYRGEDGVETMHPKWWGILGLIGWSYLFASVVYQLTRGNKYYLALAVLVCTLIYAAGKTSVSETYTILHWTRGQTGNSTHVAIALCGMILTLLFLAQQEAKTLQRRVVESLIFAALLLVAGYFLRPYFFVAKLGATPSWGFYSSAIAIVAFLFLYWVTDVKMVNRWTNFFRPAGSQPLLTYIIPFIMWALYSTFHFYPLPEEFRIGVTGVVYCLIYPFVVVWIVLGLNKLGVKLQL